MNAELLEALALLEKEKNISREVLLEAIQQSLLQAYKNQYEKTDNVTVTIDPETADYHIIASKEVVESVEDPAMQIDLFSVIWYNEPEYRCSWGCPNGTAFAGILPDRGP